MLGQFLLGVAGTAQTIADALTSAVTADVAAGAVDVATLLLPLVGGFAMYRWTRRQLRGAIH